MPFMSTLHKLLSWLPSRRVFYAALLLVVIPLAFYKLADLLRSNDPPWKTDQDETTRTSGPAAASLKPQDQSSQGS
ncbi:hypothetical protein [Paenibacillus kobensis]|uniref:hypothetical protein n=1 Tax=Paenibacillus kobensis TaxID=59841 RepID=UPI000FD8163E|nr:hypothetical protein [Paenibacillus kobensis]